jgi:uncharacterized protein (TIGR03000 family)
VIYDEAAPNQSMPAAPSMNGPNNPPQPPAPGTGANPPAPAPMSGAMYRSLDGAQTALLSVNVPAEAKIFINGTATTSTGSERQYVSRGLSSGNRYDYEVRAEITRDGNTITETKNVTLTAGQQANVSFNFEGKQEAPIAGKKASTKLTIHVPADAKVYLAGRETSSTGEVREFTTSKLTPGTEWNNYTVHVVANVDGRDVSKDETITLTGGEDRDLTFDFNANPIASTAAVTR